MVATLEDQMAAFFGGNAVKGEEPTLEQGMAEFFKGAEKPAERRPWAVPYQGGAPMLGGAGRIPPVERKPEVYGVKAIEKGNLDPFNRKELPNPDGSISTSLTKSFSFNENGRTVEVVIPTVVDGKKLSDSAAINRYKETGEHFGKFSSIEAAGRAASAIHDEQERRSRPSPSATELLSDGAKTFVNSWAQYLSALGASGPTMGMPSMTTSKELGKANLKYAEQAHETAQQAREGELPPVYELPPAEGFAQKAVRGLAGAGAFATQMGTMPGGAPTRIGKAIVGVSKWAALEKLHGGSAAEGAGMGLAFETIHALPLPGLLKTGLESAVLAGATWLGGGDLEEMTAAGGIPWFFKAGRVTVRGAKAISESLRTRQGADYFAKAHPEVADQIASKEEPSRKDVGELAEVLPAKTDRIVFAEKLREVKQKPTEITDSVAEAKPESFPPPTAGPEGATVPERPAVKEAPDATQIRGDKGRAVEPGLFAEPGEGVRRPDLQQAPKEGRAEVKPQAEGEVAPTERIPEPQRSKLVKKFGEEAVQRMESGEVLSQTAEQSMGKEAYEKYVQGLNKSHESERQLSESMLSKWERMGDSDFAASWFHWKAKATWSEILRTLSLIPEQRRDSLLKNISFQPETRPIWEKMIKEAGEISLVEYDPASGRLDFDRRIQKEKGYYSSPNSGEPILVDVFRGSGRKDKGSVYTAQEAEPILGQGKYYALNEGEAKDFGPNVEKGTILLRNPLFIRSNEDLRKIGIREIPYEREGFSEFSEAANRAVSESGHDSVVIEVPISGDVSRQGQNAKSLRRLFSVSQVFIPEGKVKQPKAPEYGKLSRADLSERVKAGDGLAGKELSRRGFKVPKSPNQNKLAAALAYRSNPLTLEDVKKTKSDQELAALLASRIPGASVSKSKTTESGYVLFPGGGSIRFSSHQKFGRNIPTDINKWPSKQELVSRIDRAVRAVAYDARTYKDVPKWDELKPKEALQGREVAKAGEEVVSAQPTVKPWAQRKRAEVQAKIGEAAVEVDDAIKRVAAKLTGEVRAGFDPELVAEMGRLVKAMAKKGIYQFEDAVLYLADKLPDMAKNARAFRVAWKESQKEFKELGEPGDVKKIMNQAGIAPPEAVSRQRPKAISPALAEQVASEHVTSIKNAVTELKRSEYGLKESAPGIGGKFDKIWESALREVAADPGLPERTVKRLGENPTAVNAREDALLLCRQVELEIQYDKWRMKLESETQKNDNTGMTEASAELSRILGDIDYVLETDKAVGTETSMGLSFRRALAKRDFTLARMVTDATVANNGVPLSADQRATIESLNQKITETQRSFDEYVKRTEEKLKQQEVQNLIDKASKPRKEPTAAYGAQNRFFVKEAADQARARLVARLTGEQLHAGIDPAILTDLVTLGGYHLEAGAREFSAWSKAMVKDLGEKAKPYLDQTWAEANSEYSSKRQEIAGEKIRKSVKAGNPIQEMGQGIRNLAEEFVRDGVTDRDVLVDKVHEVLVEIVPEVTRRQTMDAISGYGEFSPLNKDAIKAKLRDLKGQMQQVAKLQDMEAGQAPSKTGIERRLPSDEERRLIKLVNEAKKKGGFEVTDPETQLRSALDAVKTRLTNQIADLEYQLSTGERIVKEKKATPTDAEVKGLVETRDALREDFDKMFGQREVTDEQRIKTATASLERSIADYERRIAEGEIQPRKILRKTPSTPELEALRSKRDSLREELQTLRDAANPKKTPEQIALQAYKSRMANEIEKLQEKMATGDYAEKPKRTLTLDNEAIKLKAENELVKARYRAELDKYRRMNRSIPEKIIGGVGEVLNLTRAIITSFDLSAVLRQGGFVVFGHPVRGLKAFPAMFKSLLSKKQAFRVDAEIKSRENYPQYVQGGLYLSEHGQPLARMEEAFMTHWSERIPVVAGTQRAYTTFLNRLRADSFDAMAKSLGKGGKLTKIEASAVANFINVATGRGNVRMSPNSLVGLNTIFFAPRYVASRFQLLAGQPLYRGTLQSRALIAGEYARFLTGIGIIYGLASLSDDLDVTFDPRSADFGKIRFGNTRIDLLSGLAQTSVLIGRLVTGQTKTAKGEVYAIRGKEVPYGRGNAADVIARFLRSKLSPAFGGAVDVMTGKNVVGEEVTPVTTAERLVVPLAMKDVYDAMKEHGVPTGVALGLLAMFGASLQTYAEKGSDKNKYIISQAKALSVGRPKRTGVKAKDAENFERYESQRAKAIDMLLRTGMGKKEIFSLWWKQGEGHKASRDTVMRLHAGLKQMEEGSARK